MHQTAIRLGEVLYHRAPRLHHSLYSLYKAASDREERRLLATWLKSGSVVLDVGANIGVYTAFLARIVGPQGRVHAFEPERENVLRLTRATRHLPQVTVVSSAVTDRSGSHTLYISTDLNVDHRTYDSGDGRRTIDVSAVALDDYLSPDVRVDAIKLDIQGAELDALQGAARVLRDNRCPLLFEHWPYGVARAGRDPGEIVGFLEREGYGVSTTRGERVPTLDPRDPKQYVNLVARPR